jgi:hypothetical protein
LASIFEPQVVVQDVLLGDRNAGQRAGAAGGDAGIRRARHFQALFAVDRDEGVDFRIQALDAVEEQPGQFDAGKLLRRQRLRQFPQAGADHSITFGTR